MDHEWAREIPCRNVALHGFCQRVKECPFQHGGGSEAGSTYASSARASPRFDAKTSASFTPGSAGASASASLLTPTPVAGVPGLASGVPGLASPPPVATNPSSVPAIYPPSHSLLQYHLYAPDPPPHVQLPLKPNERIPESLFIPNQLRETLVKRNLAALQLFPSNGALPEVVQDYFALVPLDFNKNSGQSPDRYHGLANSLYKVFSNVDGKLYILRRIHGLKPQPNDAAVLAKLYQTWSHVDSNAIIKLRDLFITTKFGDSSLCLVYDYYPAASSLYHSHLVNFLAVAITEKQLWAYLVQLVQMVKVVHAKGLAIRELDWDKVLLTGEPGRIKLMGLGAHEIVSAFLKTNDTYGLEHAQQRDYRLIGELLINLASRMDGANKNTKEIQDMALSPKFKTVLSYLMQETRPDEGTGGTKTVSGVSSLCMDEFFDALESFSGYTDYMEGILSKELENARLFRLTCKLNFIFGRVESRVDINWSEPGDKFPIVLFYDYVFHQVDESGKPVMDLTHVLRCLNKLDAGVPEKLILVTADEMNCIIISYRELKDLIDSTFTAMSQ